MAAFGPLDGIRTLEFAGLGPAPFACMMLADMGAEVVRIERVAPDAAQDAAFTVHRGRAARLVLDLKDPPQAEQALSLARSADLLIEGFRPGVMERLGLGPADCLAANRRLVYGRMTGWGQNGPLSGEPGHDINYLALSGALHATGPAERPMPPLSLIGDYAGAMNFAFGLLAALHAARTTGKGQIVDAAMLDSAALLMAIFYGFHAHGQWIDKREANMVDGGAYYYGAYECADGKFVAIGAIEPQFHDPLMAALGIADLPADAQWNRSLWPALRERVAAAFRTRTRDDWARRLETASACLSPVLSMEEAPHHPHNVARGLFGHRERAADPAPAPRFSETSCGSRGFSPSPEESAEVLRRWRAAS